MGLGIHIDVTGDAAIERRLIGMAHRARNMKPVLSVIAGQMRDQVEEQFIDGQGNWEPLAESTLARKARLGLDSRILIATDAMRRSFVEDDAPDHIEHISDDELYFGSSDPKAGFHQGGTSRMPARRILDFAEGNFRTWTREIQRYLIGLEGGLGQDAPVWLK